MPVYALRVSLDHTTFRIPSLLSIAELYGFEIKFISENLDRGIILVELKNDEHVDRLLERGVLIFTATRLLAEATSYDDLHAYLHSHPEGLSPYLDKSFKFTIEGVNHRVVGKRQLETINAFAQHGMTGTISLKDPEVEYVLFEDYEPDLTIHLPEQRLARDGKFQRVYFGIRVGEGRARPLIYQHSVKTRAYFGNTSMEAEMGFLMAGQALPAPGKLVYDPFVGTGSMLYACAQWGAACIGSDIDGRQIRGKGKGKGVTPGILRAAEQYGVRDQILDCMTFDVTKNPWRTGGWLDAVITDPPYGVRAGAKRLGKRETRKPAQEEPFLMPDGTYSHERPDYVPPSRPYELVNLTRDLVLFARWILVPKGRLVFFLPTVSEDYDAVDVPVIEGMREIKWGEGSVQDFGKWGRRLITMEKTATDDGPRPTFDAGETGLAEGEKIPGHFQFRERYFGGFAPRTQTEQDSAQAQEPEKA